MSNNRIQLTECKGKKSALFSQLNMKYSHQTTGRELLMSPDIEVTYKILVNWSKSSVPKYYKNLSEEYKEITGEWYEPHGSWDKPLSEINQRLSVINAPPITALVFSKKKNEPGINFWGSATNVPERPRDDSERLSKLYEMINQIKRYSWPDIIP